MIPGLIIRIVQQPLELIENALISHSSAPKAGPVFITGLPRSGTTLLYQCLVQAFPFSYITNTVAKYRKIPVLTTRLNQPFRWLSPNTTFTSDYGRTHGWNRPSEGWQIMNRWFKRPDNDYLEFDDVGKHDRQQIRGTVAGIERAMRGPFLSKNVMYGVRLLALAGLFPHAVFIITRRDHLAVAQSILRGRIDNLGSKHAWFSVRPHNWENCRNDNYIEQICQQISLYEQDTTRGINVIGHNRFIHVPYDKLCQDPEAIMENLSRFFAQHMIPVRRRCVLPPSFEISSRRTVEDADYFKLRSELERLALINGKQQTDKGPCHVESE